MVSKEKEPIFVLVSNGTNLYILSNPVRGTSYTGYSINLGVVTLLGNFSKYQDKFRFLAEKDGIV